MIRKFLPELGILALLLLLPLLLFAPVVLGSKTLLPVDYLFLFEPYCSAADELGVSFPHNHLVADLILENYAWKRFLVEALQGGELPLWDPYIFAGHPFLANGQHSGLYPLSVVFYILPLWRAYGVFVWLQLGVAGVFAYLFARVLGIRRLGGMIAGITFQLSGFMLVSAVPHPMNIAGASWLPFILAMVELIVQQREALGRRPATLPWALLGAVGLGCQMLVGHGENTGFVFLVTGAYALWRLVSQQANRQTNKRGLVSWLVSWFVGSRRAIVWLALMLVLGLALGAVQFVPMYEVVASSFRGGEAAASLQDVMGWAYPKRRLITFGIPNFFGSPAHHGYFDLFTGRWTPAQAFENGQYIDWGIKNYVEGGAYLGLLPLFLAVIAVIHQFANLPKTDLPGKGYVGQLVIGRLVSWFKHPYIPFFTLLGLFSLGCIFGTPLYALVYVLPLFNQSHSPFRWVFPLTLCVAVLAGFGADAVTKRRERHLQEVRGDEQKVGGGKRGKGRNLLLLNTRLSLVTLLAALAFWGGIVTLAGLIFSRVFFAQIEPLVERVFLSLAKAPEAFLDHRAFYSYEFKWVALFGLLLTATGIVLRVSRCPIYLRRRPVWQFLAVGVLAVDLTAWGAGFGPAVDPALLEYVPPVVEFLRQDTTIWRYASYTPPGTTKTMNANVGMFYDLQTVDGYDSLFTAQYRDYMALIEPQGETLYNRIASFHQRSSLDSPLTDLLNVKYVITEVEIEGPKYKLVYQDDAVRVYQNLGVMPRAFTLPTSATLETDDFAAAVQRYDPRNYVILEAEGGKPETENPQPATAAAVAVEQPVADYKINEVVVTATVSEPSWLVLADSYFPGWKAFVQGGVEAEREVEIQRVNGTFRGVRLEPGVWRVRFKYSPDSVKIGAFVSFIAGMTILFLASLYLWRFFYREEDDASTVKRVAKNSIAPIILNLFNQLINFAFVALMARILEPAGVGRYDWAVFVFGLFNIIVNFGLEVYLVREVACCPDQARKVFANTTVLRLLLFVAAIPLLAAFLAGRQALGQPLETETIWTVVLLYAGLLPGTVANGLTGLFRARQKHEYPAAIQTVTIIVYVTLGVLALTSGMGIVGVAGASALANVVTMTVLAILAQRVIWPGLPRERGGIEAGLLRGMLAESWPLMLPLLLQGLFPTVNVLLLQQWHGDTAVGWYGAGRKWVDALNIIPSFFTTAVFPVMSLQAAQDRPRLRRSYRLSVKLLLLIALPVAVLVTLLATLLVGVLSGEKFLPHGAVALQILIWSAVFGWINSLTNYVLIALNRQRYVLLASGARVLFTIAANFLFVARLGYVASAWILVAGELLLVLLFCVDLHRQLGAVGWGQLLWRTLLAALLMGGVVWGVSTVSPALALLAGVIVYPLALALLRALSPEERALLARLVPAPLLARLGWKAQPEGG